MRGNEMIEIPVTHKNLNLIIVVDKFSYQPEEKRFLDYPGCPESVEPTEGIILLDEGNDFEMNEEEKELYEKLRGDDDEDIFRELIDIYAEEVDSAILKYINCY